MHLNHLIRFITACVLFSVLTIIPISNKNIVLTKLAWEHGNIANKSDGPGSTHSDSLPSSCICCSAAGLFTTCLIALTACFLLHLTSL